MWRNSREAIAALVVAMLPVVCAAEVIDRVLALVGGTVITQTDAAAALSFGLIPRPAASADPVAAAVDALIRRQLILDEVNRYAATEVDPAVVAKRMDEIRAQFASPEEYRAAMARTAMNERRLRDAVAANVRIEEYMTQRFGVSEPTDEEVAAYYAAHQSAFKSAGRQLSLQESSIVIRQHLVDEKRSVLIDDWVARLRRRAEVTNLYFADAAR
jgi:hypothetical protein